MFSLIPQDKANHEVYGARIAAVCAIATMLALPFDHNVLAGAVAASLSALLAGIIKEMRDRRRNRAASMAGVVPLYNVESADALATAQGGLVVALPLLVVWLLA